MLIKKILTLLILLSTIISNSQKLEKCSQCSSIKYSEKDIINNELFELQLLRNEIFARHNFYFKNDRLNEYFSNYNWYKPDYNDPIKKVTLNTVEKLNVQLFKTKEETIKKNRSLLISELKKLKTAIKQNNLSYIKTFINGVIKIEDNSISSLLSAIETVLSSIDIDAINWYKGKAQYEILTDNGFSVSSKGIYIKGNSITIMSSNPMQHSNLMANNDAFEYPSNYYSESESTNGAELEFKNGKLILITPIFAG